MEEKLLKLMDSAMLKNAKYDISKILRENKEKRFNKILMESYGSFPAQYQIAKNISNKLIQKFVNREFTQKNNEYTVTLDDNSPSFGNVIYKLTWVYADNDAEKEVKGNSYYDNGKHIVNLSVITKKLYKPEMVGTIAHEIMHVFQRTLDKVHGVNEKSMLLYQECLGFMHDSVSVFSEYFFYGLYICFSFEAAANISSVANYMERYFAGLDFLKIKSKDYSKALIENQKYNNYQTVLNTLTNTQPTYEDKKYITECMTTPIVSNIDGNEHIIYNSDNFNVDIFIEKNVKNICKVCQETMDKMKNNIMVYVEDEQEKLKNNLKK